MLKLFQLFAILLAATFFANAYADNATYAQSQAQEFIQALDAKTKLTPEQQDSLKTIMINSINQREAIIKSHQGQKGIMVKKQIRGELETLNETTQSEVKNIPLDDQQYQAFLDVQQARQEQLRDRINSEF